MEELEKKIKSLSTKVGKIANRLDRIEEDVAALKGIDSEKKAYSDLVRSVIIEIANIIITEHDSAVEEKVRKRVDKLKTLVNPLR